MTRPPMRWWGWGVDRDATTLSTRALSELRTRFDLTGETFAPVPLSEIPVKESNLSKKFLDAITGIVPEHQISKKHEQRVLRRAGKSYPDLIQMRLGEAVPTPDLVVQPETAEQIDQILKLCQREHVAVIPFGGGTSVVGGVQVHLGTCHAAISLDLRSFDRLLEVDPISRLVTVQAGMRCYELEQALEPYGLMLGHFPQSFEYVSVGGSVATRSAGQNSTGYGRIDELVAGVTMVTPQQKVVCEPMVRRAAGPELREFIIGSEGVFGVLTDITLQVRERPQHRYYCGYMLESFQAGEHLCRELAELDQRPTLVRLSDEQETAMTLLLSGGDGLQQRAFDSYLRMRHVHNGCLFIIGWEGSELSVEQGRKQAVAALKNSSAIRLGTKPGSAWVKHRFGGPYLRDELMNLGVFVETLETATVWRNIPRLYGAVRKALTDSLTEQGVEPIIMCHISHLYETGASLYFTFIARQKPGIEALSQWQHAKEAACQAILANKGTISHHHAVGRDHARWLPTEIGEGGVVALQQLKDAFDPTGIMNPGKLIS